MTLIQINYINIHFNVNSHIVVGYWVQQTSYGSKRNKTISEFQIGVHPFSFSNKTYMATLWKLGFAGGVGSEKKSKRSLVVSFGASF